MSWLCWVWGCFLWLVLLVGCWLLCWMVVWVWMWFRIVVCWRGVWSSVWVWLLWVGCWLVMCCCWSWVLSCLWGSCWVWYWVCLRIGLWFSRVVWFCVYGLGWLIVICCWCVRLWRLLVGLWWGLMSWLYSWGWVCDLWSWILLCWLCLLWWLWFSRLLGDSVLFWVGCLVLWERNWIVGLSWLCSWCLVLLIVDCC